MKYKWLSFSAVSAILRAADDNAWVSFPYAGNPTVEFWSSLVFADIIWRDFFEYDANLGGSGAWVPQRPPQEKVTLHRIQGAASTLAEFTGAFQGQATTMCHSEIGFILQNPALALSSPPGVGVDRPNVVISDPVLSVYENVVFKGLTVLDPSFDVEYSPRKIDLSNLRMYGRCHLYDLVPPPHPNFASDADVYFNISGRMLVSY